MSPPDIRALCAELLKGFSLFVDSDGDSGYISDDEKESQAHVKYARALITRARAALAAEPVGEGPSGEEIDTFIDQWWEAYGKGYLPHSSDKALVAAALARWGRHAAPPAPEPGEVGDLVEWLGIVSEQFRLAKFAYEAELTDRAATLLQQLSAPAPVVAPVAVADDRDPGCVARWPECVPDDYDPRCCRFPKSCSCANAIPLPQAGEGHP